MKNGENWSEETYARAEEALGYAFSDRALLLAAFTHSSYANAHGGVCNERLEFLGDAVLQLIVTERLFREHGEDEGVLTELRKQYVARPALERAERRAGLMPFLRHAGGESNLGGKTPSNLFEAVAGAIYADGGLAPAKRFLKRFLTVTGTENFKTYLQEYVQERAKEAPVYTTRETEEGFHAEVFALGSRAEGDGTSKKAAETAAAKALFEYFQAR